MCPALYNRSITGICRNHDVEIDGSLSKLSAMDDQEVKPAESKNEILNWGQKFFVGFLFVVVGIYLFFIIAFKFTTSKAHFSKNAQDAVYAESKEVHKITLIDSGLLSLYHRLEMIKEAKKTIELEFFIFNLDRSSRLVTQALLKKAKEGVKIRILVDFSFAVFKLRPAYAQLMEKAGIQVKYYNTSAFYSLMNIQHRSHRKLLIIDANKVLTGGRNIADEYFDLSERYNYLDTDILMEGPLSKTAQSSFDLYWNSDLATEPKEISEHVSDSELENAEPFLKLTTDDESILERILKTASQFQLETHNCKDTIFVSDFPGVGEAHRKVYLTIVDLITHMKSKVIVESPYFVLREDGYNAFKKIVDSGLQVEVLTNGLYSTDAFYIVAPLWLKMDWIAQIGLKMYVYTGEPLASDPVKWQPTSPRWGIHSKRAVIDGHTTLIGTYNIDPRSANLNSEMMIVCKNNEAFAQQVTISINDRITQSKLLLADKEVRNPSALLAHATLWQKILVVLALPFATSFDFIL